MFPQPHLKIQYNEIIKVSECVSCFISAEKFACQQRILFQPFETFNRMDNRKLVQVARYMNLMEAEIVKGRLLSAEIQCMLSDSLSTALRPLFDSTTEGVGVYVLENDLEAARKILAENNAIEEGFSGE